jgi:transmembrane sensor
MTLPPPRRLARFVEPDVDDRRVDRVWASVSSRPVRSWSAWRAAELGGALVAAAAVVLLLVARPRPIGNDLAGVVVETGSSQTVTMPDGTRATLLGSARLRYDRVQSDRVETTVERGQVAFDVRHSDSRAFVVHAAAFDVVDRGTRFVVGVDGEGVSVSVETGSVQIARAHGSEPARTLTGGESWASAPSAAIVPTAAAPTAAPSSAESPAADLSAAPTPTDSVRAATLPAPSSPGPRELLQEANEARLAGRPREAASTFDALRRQFRSDPRAGLAAFELGRLRLDSLGDPRGAAEAFTDCIALAPGATFREDAEARLVEALDRAHDAGRCAAARQGYLARFPNGLHAASVAARCP